MRRIELAIEGVVQEHAADVEERARHGDGDDGRARDRTAGRARPPP
jgi:hypothetical protein